MNVLYANSATPFGISRRRYHMPRNSYYIFVIYVIIGIAYFILNYKGNLNGSHYSVELEMPFEAGLLYPFFIRFTIPWATERRWLAFTSTEPEEYIKYYILFKMLSINFLLYSITLFIDLLLSIFLIALL